MKAEIRELWDTARELVSYVGSDVDRPTNIKDLAKCNNVVVGEQIEGKNSPYEITIDGHPYLVYPNKVKHCGGTMIIIEVY